MNSKTLLIASLAGALAIPGLASAAEKKPPKEKTSATCYGVNKCKGVGDCGGKGHSCKGQNTCKGEGYLEMKKDVCLKIEGGRLTEKPETAKSVESAKP